MRSDAFKRGLYVASIVYLALPYLVFFGGWLRQPYSAVALIVLLGALAAAARAARQVFPATDGDERISIKTIAAILLPVVVVGVLAGAGGWGFQDTDWLKHNSILRDLMTEPWPVVYEGRGTRVMLTYYTAYQLPAAAVGKLLGWDAANHALFLYTLVGFGIAALWVCALTEVKAYWIAVVFLLFSGMDAIGLLMRLSEAATPIDALRQLSYRLRAFQHLEWWAGWGFAQFSSIASLVVWVPNQAIAGWLLTSLMLSDAKARCLHRAAVLYLGLCTLWAPFVTLGLIPFALVLVWREARAAPAWRDVLRGLLSWRNAAGLLTGLVVAVYLAGRFERYALPFDMAGVYKERITWTFVRQPELFALKYLRFVVLEFAVLHALLYAYLWLQKVPQWQTMRNLLVLCSVILFALPLLNWGWNNEPAMRTSIPALFITALVTIRLLGDTPASGRAAWVRRGMIAVLAIGTVVPATEYGRHVAGIAARHALVAVPAQSEVRTLFQLQETRYRDYYNFVGQYVGSADSFFARTLARR